MYNSLKRKLDWPNEKQERGKKCATVENMKKIAKMSLQINFLIQIVYDH